jgi:pimeloyl-ACP methyl ester carboxylesterase
VNGRVACDECEVEVVGVRVRYRAAGDGEPAVLVHGLAGSSRWWERTLPMLTTRHRVHLVDLPGFGAMRRAGGPFVLADAAAWLGAWLDAVKLGSAHFVGHSMGGGICLRLAAARPDAVRRLVLAAPAGLPTGRAPAGYLLPLLGAARRGRAILLPLLVRDTVRAGPRTLVRAARQLLAEDVYDVLGAVDAPTLLVFGELDAIVPPALAQVYRRELTDARLLMLERAGHVPMLDRPEAFSEAVLAFLAGQPVGQ